MWICDKCGKRHYNNDDVCKQCGAPRKQVKKQVEDELSHSSDTRHEIPDWILLAFFASIAIITVAVIAIMVSSPKLPLPLYEITLTAVSDEKVYDGTPLDNKSVKSSALADQNHTLTADYEVYDSNGNSIKGGPINVGVYTKKVGNIHIYSGNTEITDQYHITTIDGTLRILPPAPEPEPEPELEPEPTPSAADLDAIDADIVYPKEDEMYLQRYRTATVTPSSGKYSVYAFKDPTMSNDPMREGNWFYAMRDTEVTVLAESSGYSCVILNLDEGRTAGWINTKYLRFRD